MHQKVQIQNPSFIRLSGPIWVNISEMHQLYYIAYIDMAFLKRRIKLYDGYCNRSATSVRLVQNLVRLTEVLSPASPQPPLCLHSISLWADATSAVFTARFCAQGQFEEDVERAESVPSCPSVPQCSRVCLDLFLQSKLWVGPFLESWGDFRCSSHLLLFILSIPCCFTLWNHCSSAVILLCRGQNVCSC